MDTELIMFQGAIRQLALQVAEQYEGERDRDTVIGKATAMWKVKGREAVTSLADETDVSVDDALIDMCGEIFIGTIAEEVIEMAPRGQHQSISLRWQHFGPSVATAGAVPPNAVKISDYVLARDEARERFVYATSHDYHQFGHAWAYANTGWQTLSTRAIRLGSAQQSWSGGYDASRGAIVAWNVDGEQPVAVVIRDDGLEVLASPAALEACARYTDDAFTATATSGDTPALAQDEWSDVSALFAHDPARRVWVALGEQGVWELDEHNAWHHRGELPEDVLPEEIDGDRDYSNGGTGALWDAPRKRVLFWFAHDETVFFVAWDGEQLQQVSSDGLPEQPFPFFGAGGAVIAEHAQHGVVVYNGPSEGMFVLDADTWVATSIGDNAPAKSRSTQAAFAANGDAMFGPGTYADAEDDGEQNLFFVRRDGRWSQLGTVSHKSALAQVRDSGGWPILAAAGGTVSATSWRRSLKTMVWDDRAGWQLVVDEKTGEAAFAAGTKGRLRAGLFEGKDGALWAIGDRGALWRLDGNTWHSIGADSKVFGERSGFCSCYDPVGDRVVVWGGETNERTSNDTLIFEAGAWRKAASSPRPTDMQFNWDEHNFAVDFAMAFDSGLARVIRLGFEAIGVLDGDRWVDVSPRYLQDFLLPSERLLAHDPATKETLAVCYGSGVIMRLDVGGCDMLATIEPLEREGAFPFRDLVYDPATRRVHTHSDEQADDRFVLDLGPAFELAASLGPRATELPAPGPDPVRLYRIGADTIEVCYADGAGAQLTTRTGTLGRELSAETRAQADEAAVAVALAQLARGRRADGYVSARELDRNALLRALARPAWSLQLAEAPAAPGEQPTSRLGGLPSGVSAQDWPRDRDDEPLGFLLQLETPGELHAGGVAVFCSVDGEATADEANNVALLLTPQQLAAGPGTAPEGAPMMAATALSVGERTLVVDPNLSNRLGADDAELAEALDRVAADAGGVHGYSYLGGYPAWVQAAATDMPLLAQLDFDGINVSDEEGWEEAGLFGVVYAFVHDGEAFAMWQYT